MITGNSECMSEETSCSLLTHPASWKLQALQGLFQWGRLGSGQRSPPDHDHRRTILSLSHEWFAWLGTRQSHRASYLCSAGIWAEHPHPHMRITHDSNSNRLCILTSTQIYDTSWRHVPATKIMNVIQVKLMSHSSGGVASSCVLVHWAGRHSSSNTHHS